MPVTIRPARVHDVEAFVSMKNDAWRWAYADILPPEHLAALSVDAQARYWRDVIASPDRDRVILIALDEDRVVGVASSGASGDEDASPSTGELDVLYLLPDHVGTGLGRELHDRALAVLRDAGFDRATLWVLEANERGRGFYEHVGWRPDGTRGDHMVECANHPMLRYAITL